MGKQLTVKAWKSSYNFHFCLDRSLIRKCRNLYWIETSEQQVSLQEVMHPFGWKTNAVTVWNPSLHTLYKLTLQIQQILRSTDPLEASSSTLNIVLTHLLCWAFITETSRNSDGQYSFYSPLFTPHHSRTSLLPRTNQFFKSEPECMTGCAVNHLIWGFGSAVNHLIWGFFHSLTSQTEVEAPHKRKGRL